MASAEQLLDAVHAKETLAHLLRQSRLAPAVFERDLQAAIERYAEFVQLMPASESHHHAHAGGLLAHALEMTLAAMTWRNGYLLPQGAQAELVDAQRDQWTYVVFFATLLHDVGKPLADLRVQYRKPRAVAALRWMPLAGSLVNCGADEYSVGFAPKAERDYGAHQRLAITLLQQLAPPTALSFIATVPEAMHSLTRVLNGEDRDGAVAALVRRADQASVGNALMQGSRARFASAVSVPLVELLMQALRDLLRLGGAMPLNRDGAIGWVFDGSVWFVAKRLADTVREHLKQHAPDESVPGGEKNDRLFDTWQEYGCLVPNPATGQAVWYVVVHGEDGEGYRHRLTMLRFPLKTLWNDPALQPKPMAGRIEVLASRELPAAGDMPAASAPAGAGASGVAVEPGQRQAQGLSEATEPASPTANINADAASGAVNGPPVASKRSKAAAAPVPAPRFEQMGAKKGRTTPSAQPQNSPGEATGEASLATTSLADDDDLLDDDDSANAEAKKSRVHRSALGGLQAQGGAPTSADGAEFTQAGAGSPATQLGPVVLPSVLPKLPADDDKQAPEVALAFMRWLQERLASREIRYNESGAPVHFVAQGMALVSPLIFREYARHAGLTTADSAPNRLGLDVQREVLRAGWHVTGPGGVNVLQYAVLKRGGVRSGKLAVVVLGMPQRWVYPVPPSNPALSICEAQ